MENCSECHRLWRDYASATVAHIRDENRLKLAALDQRTELVRALTLQVEAAARNRDQIREDIHRHETAHKSSTAVMSR